MEKIIRTLDVLAYIGAIVSFLLIVFKFWLQYDYERSTKKLAYNIRGLELNFTDGIGKLVLIFLVCLSYLIAN